MNNNNSALFLSLVIMNRFKYENDDQDERVDLLVNK